MAQYITFNLTANGHARIFDPIAEQVWDENAGAMGAISSVTSANAAVSVPYTSAHKCGLVTMPTALPEGNYKMALYNAATGSDTDEAVSLVDVIKRPHSVFVFEDEIVLREW